jgi:UDP-N-acetylmuramoyl-tripeptide--D-alanyl-D-alanine ligase
MARPAVGVVTNVGSAHLGLFGSREAIREAKAELPEALPPEGTAVLNADDPVVRSYAERTPARVVRFGRTTDVEVGAADVALDRGSGRARFRLLMPAGEASVVLPVVGEHMVPNALGAAGVGHAFGLSVEDVVAGLEEARVSSGRMDVFATTSGVRVIDDAYNANPASMAAALETLRAMAAGGEGRTIAVLGPMAELGAAGEGEHERVGELVARLGIDRLVTVGPDAAPIARGAERGGLGLDRIVRSDDAEGAAQVVRELAVPGDLVLVKASRVTGLDRLAADLRSPAGPDRPGPTPTRRAAIR